MSLRTDIRTAFDEVAPSTFGLPERVVQTVVREVPLRRRKERWFLRLRAPLSMVAVLLLLSIAVGVLVGGRVVRDWNAFTQPAPAGPSELAKLETRPLVLTALKAGDPCPVTPLDQYGLYGSGPVVGADGSAVSNAWGTYWYPAVVTDSKLTSLVLVRARDLHTGQPVIFVGNWATGPLVGTDTFDGVPVQQRGELVLDTRHPSLNTLGPGSYTWAITAGRAKGSSACIGWQTDTTGYPTEVFVPRQIPT